MSLEAILSSVKAGFHRPSIPAGTTNQISSIMEECWSQRPASRPTFSELEGKFDSLQPEDVYSSAWARPSRYPVSSNCRQGGEHWLSQFFPAEVVRDIERGKKVRPQQLEQVSIFFSDVVGFTALSGKMDADRVSDMLDRLYTALDR